MNPAGADALWPGEAWPTTVVGVVAACTPNTAAAPTPREASAPDTINPVRRRCGSGAGVISALITNPRKGPLRDSRLDPGPEFPVNVSGSRPQAPASSTDRSQLL